MQSNDFKEGLDYLIKISREGVTAIMCAEVVPWRCHRSLVGDALMARGIPVDEIINPGNTRPHKLTPFAVVKDSEVTYPRTDSEEEGDGNV